MGKIRYNRTGRTLVCPFGHECQFFDPRNNHWDSTPLLPVGIAAGTQNAAGFAADAPELDRIPV